MFQELKKEIALERRQTMQSLYEALPIQNGRSKEKFLSSTVIQL